MIMQQKSRRKAYVSNAQLLAELRLYRQTQVISNELGRLLMMMAEKYCLRGNLRGYSYADEMRQEAIAHMVRAVPKFDEAKMAVPNPFAFFTTVMSNAVKKVLNAEKRGRELRDDLLEAYGQMPSLTRQMAGHTMIEPSPVAPVTPPAE